LFTAVFLSLIGVIIYLLRRTKKTNIELKNTQEELQKLNNTLEDKVKHEIEKNKQHQLFLLQQGRLVQMGEMISMIAHQWRQPLNILAMLNQTIVLKYKEKIMDDNVIDYFNKNSNVQIKQMSQTIDDFRNFFKPEKETVEFYINEVISETINMIKPILINDKIEIRLNINDEIKITGYPNELGQAILNMINNAKDALLEKNIKVKTISISLAHVNDRPTLIISDNAGGISEKIIDKIFNPYFSTKEKNGTGLGLYMTKMIIEEHMNAKLVVTNNTEGAVFTVTF
jgi:signal transduction histidine kinase